MFKQRSTDSRVFRSETYLTTEYKPKKPVGREQEVKTIADAVRPLKRRKKGENLLLYGPSGVAKTTCTRYVLEKLDSETRVKTVLINCWQYNTRPSLLTELLIRLGYPAPRKGKPVDELLSKIREWLDKNGPIALALDEFDQLKEGTEVVYDLHLLNNQAKYNIGLLMITNQHPTQIQLEPRSTSRLSCQTLEFQPYDADELTDVLRARTELAFKPGAIADKAIRYVAEKTADHNGDCRHALNKLLRAGRQADKDDTNKVTVELIEQAL